MAVLPLPDRVTVWAELMRGAYCPGVITKADFRAAIDAVDDLVDSAAATRPATSFNAALPVAYRNAATAAQKAQLLSAVALRRFASGV